MQSGGKSLLMPAGTTITTNRNNSTNKLPKSLFGYKHVHMYTYKQLYTHFHMHIYLSTQNITYIHTHVGCIFSLIAAMRVIYLCIFVNTYVIVYMYMYVCIFIHVTAHWPFRAATSVPMES